MTSTTVNGVDWRRVLERAEKRYMDGQRPGDMIGVLVEAVEAQLVEGAIKPATNQLNIDLLHAQDELAERDADNVRLADLLGELRRELDLIKAERAELREKLKKQPKPEPHRHQYSWAGPDDMPGPCECGHPYPRDLHDDPDDDAGDSTVQAPWDQVISRVRDELEGVWP